MKVSIACFSPKGRKTAEKIEKFLSGRGDTVEVLSKGAFAPESKSVSLGAWTRDAFSESDAIVFVGAVGIAVRHVAPYVKDKRTDPAVIGIDELGRFVIPLLSGHLGGANELATEIAERLGSVPVITTATDIHGLVSPDVFAKKNNLHIGSMKAAKDVAGALVAGREVCFFSEYPVEGKIPKELTVRDSGEIGICVSGSGIEPFEETLSLVPRNLILGIGCRRDTDAADIEGFLDRFSREAGFLKSRVSKIASIDLKSDEEGLLEFSESLGIEPEFFTPDELGAVEGEFDESEFVLKTTGVGNVCERSAVAAGGRLVHGKTSGNGITMAVAETPFTVKF